MQILRRAPYIASLALAAYMPLHIFLAQSLSLLTGGLEAWKVGKDVLLILATLFTICLVFLYRKGNRVFYWLLAATAAYGGLHLLLWLFHPDIYGKSAMLGIIYNMRLPLAVVLGMGSALLLPKFVFSSAIKVILGISTFVAILGIVQFLLPGDLLTHVGYSIERGARPSFYIDDNFDLPHRIMSTLREPNALGAYLILPATAFAALFIRSQDKNKLLVYAGAFGLHALAILLTFSRSAWLGLALSVVLVAWWRYSEGLTRVLRQYWPVVAGLALVAAIGVFSVRNTYFFQQYIVHSNSQEEVQDLDSNDYHLLFIQKGLEGIQADPEGHGPGTAGLASIQNPEGSFLTENYYVQIGYELGIVGLLLFIAINIYVYLRIRATGGMWGMVLLASFWAYVLTNMLLHSWANEAVAVQWWLLAGMAIAYPVAAQHKKTVSKRKARSSASRDV
jgi:hypothetical protein